MSATEDVDDAGVPVASRRRAVILGLVLGAGCLALMVTCIIIFSTAGLPKDPKEWKRLQQQRAAAAEQDALLQPQPQPQKDQPR